MARDARATIIGGGTLLEPAAVSLAGLTALAVLLQAGTDRTACPAPAQVDVQQHPASIVSQLVPDLLLQDVSLHD